MAEPEFYVAPIDGQHCLRVEGRIRRLKLPLPAEPPHDVAPAACFLCHPERDRFDLGAWPNPGSPLRLVGNAHSFADRTLLLAPSGEQWHDATPPTLPLDLLTELLSAPFDETFVRRAELRGLDQLAFLNLGVRAAQSRRHLHVQIVAFRRERAVRATSDAAALADDLAHAEREERVVRWSGGLCAIVPRRPGMTAELWLPLPLDGAPRDEWTSLARTVQHACSVCERTLSGSYNLVARHEAPRLLRLIPRGLSERAGLELAAPDVLGSFIGASVRETALLWQSAAPTASTTT